MAQFGVSSRHLSRRAKASYTSQVSITDPLCRDVISRSPAYKEIMLPIRQQPHCLTLRLLMSYIYGAPSKARNANVVYIWTYVWQR